MQDVDVAKRRERARVLALRRALGPAERRLRSERVHRILRTLPELASARVVAAYAASPVEVDLDGWLVERLAAGTGVLLPRVAGEALDVVGVADLGTDLTVGYRGIREPRRSAPAWTAEVDAVVVPGVAFDARGGRLGAGGGHIDRLLARLGRGPTRVGVAFHEQVVESVPLAAHDERVHVVVTDAGVLRA